MEADDDIPVSWNRGEGAILIHALGHHLCSTSKSKIENGDAYLVPRSTQDKSMTAVVGFESLFRQEEDQLDK